MNFYYLIFLISNINKKNSLLPCYKSAINFIFKRHFVQRFVIFCNRLGDDERGGTNKFQTLDIVFWFLRLSDHTNI
jgi:hypothetical protein